ncbi:hypothetical protein [Fangia hongkongensis]|nr:hypothetical protein [Fangia hongkongensis]
MKKKMYSNHQYHTVFIKTTILMLILFFLTACNLYAYENESSEVITNKSRWAIRHFDISYQRYHEAETASKITDNMEDKTMTKDVYKSIAENNIPSTAAPIYASSMVCSLDGITQIGKGIINYAAPLKRDIYMSDQTYTTISKYCQMWGEVLYDTYSHPTNYQHNYQYLHDVAQLGSLKQKLFDLIYLGNIIDEQYSKS